MNMKNMRHRANILTNYEDRYIQLLEKVMEAKGKDIPSGGLFNEMKVQYVGYHGAACLLDQAIEQGKHKIPIPFDLNLEDGIEAKVKRHVYDLDLEEISRDLIEKKSLRPVARSFQKLDEGSVMALKQNRTLYGMTKARMLALDFNFRTNAGTFENEYEFAGFTYDVLKSDGEYGNDDEVVMSARYVRDYDKGLDDFRVALVPGMQLPIIIKKDRLGRAKEENGIANIPGLKSKYKSVDRATGWHVRNTLMWTTDKTQETQDFLDSKNVLPKNYVNHWLKIAEEDGLFTPASSRNYRKISNGSTGGVTGTLWSKKDSLSLIGEYLEQDPKAVRLPDVHYADHFIDVVRRHNYLVDENFADQDKIENKVQIQFTPHES